MGFLDDFREWAGGKAPDSVSWREIRARNSANPYRRTSVRYLLSRGVPLWHLNAYLYSRVWEETEGFPWQGNDVMLLNRLPYDVGALPWEGLRNASLSSGVMIEDVPTSFLVARCLGVPLTVDVASSSITVSVAGQICFCDVTGPPCGLLTTLTFANGAECVLAAQSDRCGLGGDVAVGLPVTPNGGDIRYHTGVLFSARKDNEY